MAYFENENYDKKSKNRLAEFKQAQKPDAFNKFIDKMVEVGQSRLLLRVSQERGKEVSVAFTIGGVGVALLGIFLIKQNAGVFHGGLLGAMISLACAVWVGHKLSKNLNLSFTQSSTPEERSEKVTKDFDQTSRQTFRQTSMTSSHWNRSVNTKIK